MVLQIALTRIYQESEMNHKSVVGKKKNECYYKIFLERGSNKSRSNAEYF